MITFDKGNAKYWRGLVTGTMIGAGAALLFAQRKRSEESVDVTIGDTLDEADDEEMDDANSGEVMNKDALDKTLDIARQAAREVKNEAKDTWNQTLEEVKTSATGIEDLSKSSTNDN